MTNLLLVLALTLGCRPDSVDDSGVVDTPEIPLDPQADEDGDGLTNGEELEGWVIGLNVTGYGDDIQSVPVTSDPYEVDTDGDGLSDLDERLFRSDPRLPDSDGDGLSDGDEIFRWSTSPTHVDTDEDARGSDPNFPQPPLAALFDGHELQLRLVNDVWEPGPGATSPTLSDTDGDGLSDYEEALSARRNPAVAELPEVSIQLSPGSSIDLSVDIVYDDTSVSAETLSSSVGLDEGRATESGMVASASLYQEVSNKTTISGSVTAGCCASVVDVNGRVENTVASTTRLTGSYETSFNASQSRDTREAWSKANERTTINAHTFESARVQLLIDLVNPTSRAYNVERLSFVAFANDGHSLKPFAIVRPESTIVNGIPTAPVYTLGPGETLGGIVLTDLGADTGFTYELMSNPNAVLLSPASYGLTDSDGNDFDFQLDIVRERTSRVTINGSDGTARHYDVATNVDRTEDGEVAGTPLRTFFELAGVDYAYEESNGNHLVTLAGQGTSLHTEAAPDLSAEHIDPGYPTSGGPGARAVLSSWSVFVQRYDGTVVPEMLDWGELRIFPGDTVVLIYANDADQDGIVDREEARHHASDLKIDTDDDGLSDFWELREPWTVSTDRISAYEVYSSPTSADHDDDGLEDYDEYLAGTDPKRSDTDGDGYPDGAEVAAGLSPITWDPPSELTVCCQVDPSGTYFYANAHDADLDATEFTLFPGNPSLPSTYPTTIVHNGDHWARFELPRPHLWHSTIQVEDELGQVATSTCPEPGTDASNWHSCPTIPSDSLFD